MSNQPQGLPSIPERIRDYLCSGGLFNPELMDHDKVRDLLVEARDEIDRLNRLPRDPNPLDPENRYFRKCLKGHVGYSASFPECPSCKIDRERSAPSKEHVVGTRYVANINNLHPDKPIPDRWSQTVHVVLAADYERLRAAPHKNDRWNIETTATGFRVCRGDHHRSSDCEWEEYVPRGAGETAP